MDGAVDLEGKLFKISEGPWKMLFSGVFEEKELEIYSNPASMILTAIYENEGEKISGVVIELFKVFSSIGEVEGFVETMPKDVIVLTKHTKKETIKYFLLESSPAYVEYDEDKFIKQVDKLIENLKTSSKLIKDVSKAYNLTLKELADSEDHIKAAFFTQPLLIAAVSTASHTTETDVPDIVKGIAKGEVILGLTKDKIRVVEPLSMFISTLVTGGTDKERKHLLHILSEGSLLSNVPVVLFDWENEFSGIGQTGKEHDALKKYKVEVDPIGFPVKKFKLTEDLTVDLNLTNFTGLAELFGIGDKNFAAVVGQAREGKSISDMDSLVKEVGESKPSDKVTEYELKKFVRLLKLIDSRYPGMFCAGNKIDEISKSWLKTLGRVGLLELKGVDNRTTLLVAHSLLAGLTGFYKTKGKSKGMRAFMVLPEIEKAAPREAENILYQECLENLFGLLDYGVGFMASTEKAMNVSEQIAKDSEAMLNIVSKNDIAVQLKNRKGYRVLIRPALSVCSEC